MFSIDKELEKRGLKNSEQAKLALLTSRDVINIQENYNQRKDDYWEKVKKYHGDTYVQFKSPAVKEILVRKKSSFFKNLTFTNIRQKACSPPTLSSAEDELLEIYWDSFYSYEIIKSLDEQHGHQQTPVEKKPSLLNKFVSRLSITKTKQTSPPPPETILTSTIEHFFDFEKELTQSLPLDQNKLSQNDEMSEEKKCVIFKTVYKFRLFLIGLLKGLLRHLEIKIFLFLKLKTLLLVIPQSDYHGILTY